MKKFLLTLALATACAGAYAQGKISMLNDTLHLVQWGSSLKGSDAALAGSLVDGASGPGSFLLVDLYGGSSVGNMTLQKTIAMSTTVAGQFGVANFTSTLPGGTSATMQIQIRESSFATAALAQQNGGYFGFSPTFTFNPSSTIAFNSIVNHGGTALSTWADAPVVVGIVPEPSTFALAGLGSAALLIFRRRKA